MRGMQHEGRYVIVDIAIDAPRGAHFAVRRGQAAVREDHADRGLPARDADVRAFPRERTVMELALGKLLAQVEVML